MVRRVGYGCRCVCVRQVGGEESGVWVQVCVCEAGGWVRRVGYGCRCVCVRQVGV